MDTYLLIVLIALFLGVMGIIAMMERRRRTEQAHVDRLQQTLAGCLDALLRALHDGNETQSAQLAGALKQLCGALETGVNIMVEASRSQSRDSVRAIEQAATHLAATVLQHQKSADATVVRAADKLSESATARSKELLAEAQRTTKAVEVLKTCLEESVKFDTNP